MSESEVVVRSVLGPTGNKTTTTRSSSNMAVHQQQQQQQRLHNKPLLLLSKSPSSKKLLLLNSTPTTLNNNTTPPPQPPPQQEEEKTLSSQQSLLRSFSFSNPRRLDHHQFSNLSLNASCSSDVSSDSLHSRASTGKIIRRSTTTTTTTTRGRRRTKTTKTSVSDSDSISSLDIITSSQLHSLTKKTCAWVTPKTEPCYAAFHDEEWGVPMHDDKKLFELLVFSGALAELSWPTILLKRHLFREVFADFDPFSVSKFNEKKITAPGSTASSLLSELKLRAIIENARQITKIIGEFGSFDKYIWSFVNYKPIVNQFRYPRQVPAKTSKADVISKDLLKRGFRSVSATVIYSFMQVAGITNDHLITCFRYHDCTNPVEKSEEDTNELKAEEAKSKDMLDVGLARSQNELEKDLAAMGSGTSGSFIHVLH